MVSVVTDWRSVSVRHEHGEGNNREKRVERKCTERKQKHIGWKEGERQKKEKREINRKKEG